MSTFNCCRLYSSFQVTESLVRGQVWSQNQISLPVTDFKQLEFSIPPVQWDNLLMIFPLVKRSLCLRTAICGSSSLWSIPCDPATLIRLGSHASNTKLRPYSKPGPPPSYEGCLKGGLKGEGPPWWGRLGPMWPARPRSMKTRTFCCFFAPCFTF